MANQTAFPSSASGSGWTNLTNVGADDGSYAVETVDSQFEVAGTNLDVTNFGFTTTGTIDGIEVEIQLKQEFETTFSDGVVQLIVGGSATGTDKGTGIDIQDTDEIRTYGGPTDKWGLTPSAAQVNASNFGVRFAVEVNTDNGPRTVSIDYIKVTVYYSAGGAQLSQAFLLFMGR